MKCVKYEKVEIINRETKRFSNKIENIKKNQML